MPLALRIGETFVGPGTTVDIDLGGTESVRVRVVCGQGAGPRLFVIAGLRGDERMGPLIADGLAAYLDPRFVHGVVYVVARAAPTAVKKKQRNLPNCGDLNRSFPGSRDGDAAQQVAFRLFRDVVTKSDFGLDLHACSDGRSSIAHARGNLSNHHIRRLCESSGATIILDTPGPARSLRRAATDFGVPTVAFESGRASRTEKAIVSEGIKGALGVMANLRMIGGEIPWRGAPTILKDARWLTSKSSGRLDVLVQPGTIVRAGEVLARIEGGENIQSPRAGLVLAVTSERQIEVGAPVCELALIVEPTNGNGKEYDDDA